MADEVGQAFSPAEFKRYYTRHLPHWHPEEACLFVTWRLFGSLPRHVGKSADSSEGAAQRFLRLDREIDRARFGPVWLKDPRVARMVVETLLAGQVERGWYWLGSYCVMPNHVHLVLRPRMELAVITRWLKGATARRANQLLGRTGQTFWQAESYDHWIRTDREMAGIVKYVHRNPVSAGLVRCESEWLWSSAAAAGGTACPTGSTLEF